MAKIIIEDVLKLVQIRAENIHPKILKELEERAAYFETGEGGSESIVSIGALDDIVNELAAMNETRLMGLLAEIMEKKELIEEVEAMREQLGTKYNYIQIIKR